MVAHRPCCQIFSFTSRWGPTDSWILRLKYSYKLEKASREIGQMRVQWVHHIHISNDEKSKVLVQIGTFREMRQCVTILDHNFQDVIKPLMEIRTIPASTTPQTTMEIHRIEQASQDDVLRAFSALRKQTRLLASFLDPDAEADLLPPKDTTTFSEMVKTLEKIMVSLQDKLLEVCN